MNIKNKITNFITTFGASINKDIIEATKDKYTFLMGDSDYANKRPDTRTRKLWNVDKLDKDLLEERGAVFNEEKQAWFVPENKSMNDFKEWWKEIPEDVLTSDGDMRTTSNGEAFNAHALTEDTLRGDDSTSTSINMVLFPLLGAFTSMVSHIPMVGGFLAFISMLALIPLVISLFQSEDIWKTLLSLGLFFVVMLAGFGGVALPGITAMYNGILGQITHIGVGLGVVIAVMFFIPNDHELSHFDAMKDRLRIFAYVVALCFVDYVAMTLLSYVGLGAIAYVVGPMVLVSLLACAYPMLYTEGNFKKRERAIVYNSKKYQAGKVLNKSADDEAIETNKLNAMYDDSPLINVGISRGYLNGKNQKKGYTAGTVLKLSLNDLSTHTLIFGQTGSGKTSSILRPASAQLAQLRDADGTPSVGMIFSDGKEAFPEEVRSVIDIMVEQGLNYAPFEGLTPINIATVMAENSAVSLDDDKNGIWAQGAHTLHQQLLTILNALVSNQGNVMNVAKENIMQIEEYIDILICEKIRLERKIAKPQDMDPELKAVARDNPELHKQDGGDRQEIDRLVKEMSKWEKVKQVLLKDALPEKKWHWTPYDYNTIKNVFANVHVSGTGEGSLNDRAKKALEELGWNASPERIKYFPETIHPDLNKEGLPLKNALIYFTDQWTNMDKGHRDSFLLNVESDIEKFIQNGNVMANDAGIPWSMIEHGEDLEQVLYGAKLGINVPESKYGKGGKMIAKMVKQRLYNAVKKRAEYKDEWRTILKGQKPVIDMMDECQSFVSNLELDFLPKARSLGLYAFFATQQFGEFMRIFHEKTNSAGALVETFQSIISYKSSKSTVEFLQNRAGMAKLLKEGLTQPLLITTNQIWNAFYNSAFGSTNQDGKAFIKKIAQRGGARIHTMSEVMEKNPNGTSRVLSSNVRKQFIGKGQSKEGLLINDIPNYEVRPLVEDDEFKSLTANQGTALFILNRANMTRIEYGNSLYCTEKDVEEFKKSDKPMGELLVKKYYKDKRKD